jgi:hypothetical protein
VLVLLREGLPDAYESESYEEEEEEEGGGVGTPGGWTEISPEEV